MTCISDRGQIVIPKFLRERFRLFGGTEVVFEATKEGVLLKPSKSYAQALEDLANEANIDLKGKVDFDDMIEAGIRKKYKKMRIGY